MGKRERERWETAGRVIYSVSVMALRGQPELNMLTVSRLPSRRLIRAFASSARRLDYFPNVDQKVWAGETFLTLSRLIFVRHQGFEQALRAKDKIVIADFHAEYVPFRVR